MRIQFVENKPLFRIDEPHASLSGMKESSAIWILAVNVDPEFQDQGIGREIVMYVIDSFPTLPVFLFAKADRPDLQGKLERFYRRLGFVEFGPQRPGTPTLMRRLP